MADLEAARQRWITERGEYDRFANAVAEILRRDLQKVGVWAEVDARAKEIHSFIRKLITKPHHTYESIGDKAGVRIVARYKSELDKIESVVRQRFECSKTDDKASSLNVDQVGYLSLHLHVQLRSDDPLRARFSLGDLTAELQIRTLAQHLWSEMSHDTFYKNDETLSPLPARLKRRIFLLSGVVEVADDEFDRLNTELPANPEIVLLKALERHYFRLTTRRGDPEMSLPVIKLLAPLYELEPQQVVAHLDEFLESRSGVLHHVYDHVADSQDLGAFIFQPEALMIYDLLESDQATLKEMWTTQFPERELERIAIAFGISLD